MRTRTRKPRTIGLRQHVIACTNRHIRFLKMSKERLKRFEEIKAPQEIIDKEKEIMANRKAQIEEDKKRLLNIGIRIQGFNVPRELSPMERLYRAVMKGASKAQ